MCGSGGAQFFGNQATAFGQFVNNRFGGQSATPTAAAAVVASPRVSTAAADAIARRDDQPRVSLGSAPAQPQQTMRVSLLGNAG